MNDPAEQADPIGARARARIGSVLSEKWRLDLLLGVGGMAAVYAATHINNGRRAAIKLLHTELGANQEVRTRFLREGYVANKVEHPGTVSILDDQVAPDGSVFLVMELLDGETLEDRRERSGVLPAHEVLSLADRLLDVLAVAHAKGIVHRDIKPENIFLTREGQVKVLDFGIARMRELQSTRMTLTSAGAIGTPAFMPPEQARGRWDEVGPRSDIWAVGATMFTLVSGRLVHEAETVNELMLAAMTKQSAPVASIVPSLPPPVAAVIDRALSYDPNQRWADARTMQSALRAAYQTFDRASISGAHAAHPGHDGGHPHTPGVALGVSGAYLAAPQSVQVPPQSMPYPGSQLPVPPGSQLPSPPSAPLPPASAQIPLNAPVPPASAQPALGPTGHATMVGTTRVIPARRPGVPLVPLVSGLVGAIILGMILLATWVSLHKPAGPAPGSSAEGGEAMPPASASVGATPGTMGNSENPGATPPGTGSTPGGDAPAASASGDPAAKVGAGTQGGHNPIKRPGWGLKKGPH